MIIHKSLELELNLEQNYKSLPKNIYNYHMKIKKY